MQDQLTYFISERNSIVVVSFVGSLTRTTLGLFPIIVEDVSARRARMVILNCHDLKQIESCAVAPFSEFQGCLRDFPSEVRICFLNHELRDLLVRQGAVRQDEIKNNLLEAVTGMAGTLGGKKAA